MRADLNNLPEIFTLKEALKLGLTPYILAKSVSDGFLEKIDRGIYRKNADEDLGEWTSLVLASKKIEHQNAVCLLSALVYHKLTEAIPHTVWLLVDFNVRSKRPGISLFRRRDAKWSIGIIKDGPLLVTDVERSLVESLVFKNKVGYNEAFYALKKALDKKRPLTSVAKIMERAKQLQCEHLIHKSLEPFIYE